MKYVFSSVTDMNVISNTAFRWPGGSLRMLQPQKVSQGTTCWFQTTSPLAIERSSEPTVSVIFRAMGLTEERITRDIPQGYRRVYYPSVENYLYSSAFVLTPATAFVSVGGLTTIVGGISSQSSYAMESLGMALVLAVSFAYMGVLSFVIKRTPVRPHF